LALRLVNAGPPRRASGSQGCRSCRNAHQPPVRSAICPRGQMFLGIHERLAHPDNGTSDRRARRPGVEVSYGEARRPEACNRRELQRGRAARDVPSSRRPSLCSRSVRSLLRRARSSRRKTVASPPAPPKPLATSRRSRIPNGPLAHPRCLPAWARGDLGLAPPSMGDPRAPPGMGCPITVMTAACAGLTVITSTAGKPEMLAPSPRANPRSRARRCLHVLLVIAFFAVQVSALAHEIQHVLHQHDAPCGLHVAADQLAMALALVPALASAPAPATDLAPLPVAIHPSSTARPSGARAPPRLS
jgi:hypothetical protein